MQLPESSHFIPMASNSGIVTSIKGDLTDHATRRDWHHVVKLLAATEVDVEEENQFDTPCKTSILWS